jgi:hypothetical protein
MSSPQYLLACLLLAAAAAAPAASAAMGPPGDPPAPVVFQPVNATARSYSEPTFLSTCAETYHLYLPDAAAHPKPDGGWPVLIHLDLSGFVSSTEFKTIEPDLATAEVGIKANHRFLARVLEAGIAVVTAQATPSVPPEETALWHYICGTAPMPTLVPGHGMFHPPGLVSPDVALSCYDSALYPMPEKDAVMIVQHVRFHAAQPESGGSGVLDKLTLLDPDRIAVEGTSAGAIALMWGALGPDRSQALPFLGLGDQSAVDSRPMLAVIRLATVWWPSFAPDFAASIGGIPYPHFGVSTGTPGASGHSEIGTRLYDFAEPADLIAGSALAYGAGAPSPVRVYMAYSDKSECDVYAPLSGADPPCGDAQLWPFCFACQGEEDTLHPAWSGYAWECMHPATRLVINGAEALTQQAQLAQCAGGKALPLIGEQGGPDAFQLSDALDIDIVNWLLDGFGSSTVPQYSEPVPWVTILRGPTDKVPGTAGLSMPVSVPGFLGQAPQLAGSGTPAPGENITLAVSGGRPLAACHLVVGQGGVYVGFKRGILVPEPAFVFTLALDSAGALSLPATWPPAAAGAHLYFQAWVADPDAPAGFAGSNGLMTIAQ